jgi:TRAP-type mannitol/chloroaromatic compound transport system permease small subunit
MQSIQSFIAIVDRFTESFGRLLAWLVLLMMLAMATVVVLRYGLEVGSIALQESITYMHASLFMLGLAYTLKHNGHVRVDIFYRHFSPRQQAWVNSLGGIIFLVPLCLFIVGISWDFVSQSWAIAEVSTEPGGIPAVFLLKALLPAMAINLLIQGVTEVLRNSLVLLGNDEGALQ